MNQTTLTPAAARDLILTECRNGRIFGATFRKKDGTMRSGTWRLASTMSKGKTGDGLRYNPSEYDLLTAYDVALARKTGALAYRMISVSTLASVTINGTTYDVEQSA